MLAGCATTQKTADDLPPGPPPTWRVPAGAGPALTPLAFNQLNGWASDHTADALVAFLTGCTQMTGGKSLGGQGQAASLGGSPAQWRAACAAAGAGFAR